MSATDEAIERLNAQYKFADSDPELAHINANIIIFRYLRAIGKDEVADAWEALEEAMHDVA